MDDRQMGQADGVAESQGGSAPDAAGLAGLAGVAGMTGMTGMTDMASAGGTRRERLRALGLWCALLLAVAGLAGAGMLVWRSLQADQAIALVARSAQTVHAPAPLPEVASAQDVAVALAAPAAYAAPAAPALAAAPVAAAGAAPPAAQGRVALAKPGKQARAPVKRTMVRGKGKPAGKSSAVRRIKANSSANSSARALAAKPVAASVGHRLALCREKSGEAAAACFARACRSYARNAPICLNDEPARRR